MSNDFAFPWADFGDIVGLVPEPFEHSLPEIMQIWPIDGNRAEHDRAISKLVKLCCSGNTVPAELLGHDQAALEIACSQLSGCKLAPVVTFLPHDEKVKVKYCHPGQDPVEVTFPLRPSSLFLYQFINFAAETVIWYEFIERIKVFGDVMKLAEGSTPPSLVYDDAVGLSCIKIAKDDQITEYSSRSHTHGYDVLLYDLETVEVKIRLKELETLLNRALPNTYRIVLEENFFAIERGPEGSPEFKTTNIYRRDVLQTAARALNRDIDKTFAQF